MRDTLFCVMSHMEAIDSRLGSMGLIPSARDWIRKALHPAGPTAPGCTIPDEVSQPTARPEYTQELIVSAPSGLSTPTWDCAMYTLPGDVTAVVVETGPAGSAFGGRSGPPAPVTGGTVQLIRCQPQALVAPVQYYFPAISADLVYEGATAQFNPLAWRRAYASLTVYMSASSLNDQGTVTAGQFPGFPVTSSVSSECYSAIGPFLQARQTTFVLPLQESDMLVSNPRCTVWDARKGIYIPQLLAGPTQPFVTPPRTDLVTAGGTTGYGYPDPAFGFAPGTGSTWAVSNTAGYVQMNSQAVVVAGSVPTDPGFSQPVLVDDGFDNLLCSVAIWRGLSPAATLTVKSIVGFEVAVSYASPVRQFVQPADPPSPQAMQAYYAITREIQQVYPSSFNVFGAILPVLATAARAVAPYALSALTAIGSRLMERYGGASAPEKVMRGVPPPLSLPAPTAPARGSAVMRPPRTPSVRSARSVPRSVSVRRAVRVARKPTRGRQRKRG